MLYLAIPAHNEVDTIGVLLWRIRTVLAEFPREYEVVVYDDASTDATADVASQYEQAMPVSVIRGERHLGYAGAVDRLLRHVAQQTRYPRRDAVLLLQGDFTDPPGIVPEFARRFEGGADFVVGERMGVADAPVAVRRLFKAAQWAMRPFVRVEGVKDTTASMRLVRISALRDAIRAVGDAPLVTGDSWTTNADLLLRLAPHARRVEAVPMEPTYGVRMRETRRIALRDALSALKWAWGARGRRAVVGSNAEVAPETDRRSGRGGAGKRREEAPELSVDRLREKIRERDGSRGIDGEPEKPRDRKRGRDRDQGERKERTERPAKAERQERAPRPEKPEQKQDRQGKPRRERPERSETDRAAAPRVEGATPAEARPPKPPRGERPERTDRPDRQQRPRQESRPIVASPLDLDDPFAPPKPNVDPFARAMDSRPSAPVEDAENDAEFTPSAGVDDVREPVVARSSETRPLVDRHANDASDDADDLDEGEDGGNEGDDAEGAAEEGGEGDESAPRRKRRRNRRSRRGRRRREGANGEDGGENPVEGGEGAGNDASSSGEIGEPTRGPRLEGARVERPARDDGDNEGDEDGGDSDESGDDSADESAEGGDDAAQNRARRRGRRGRRGGARRSRGRRDRSRGDGDGSGEGGGDAPPAGDGPVE